MAAVSEQSPARPARSGLEPDASRRPAISPHWPDDVLTLLAALSLNAVFVAWGQLGGGFDPVRWLPGALLAVGLVAAVLVGSRGNLQRDRRAWLAVGSLAIFAAWSYVSILWADVPGDAWTGANRTLMYAAIFTVFLVMPWTALSAQFVAWAFAAGVTTVAAHAVWVVSTTYKDAYFIDGRFSYPTGYSNASVALYMCGFWVALALATRRSQPPVIRGLALGASVFLAQAAFIVQSRAAMVAVPVAAVLVVAATPSRLRTSVGLGVVTVPLVVGWNTHLEVYERAEEGRRFLETAMQPSAWFMVVTAVAGVVLGLVWAFADRRYMLSQRSVRALGAAAVSVVVVVLLTGAVVFARADPVDRARTAWSELTTNETEYEGALRLGSLDSERWDHWRVGVGRFLDRPLAGIGAEQFNVDYLRQRETSVDARYAHSFGIGVLSQLGLVGALLFGVFAVLATLLARPRSGDEPIVGTIRLGAFALWTYWLVHGAVDWFYEIPAVTGPVFAFLGIAAALEPRSTLLPPPGRWRTVATILGVVACAAALIALASAYLAAREVKVATKVWAADPEAAFDHLERARILNPLSDEPDLYAASIATRLGDRARMRLYFTRTLERNPFNWYARLQLGLTYELEGRRQDAIREVRRAQELNPADDILEDVVEKLDRGERVTPRSVDRLFLERILERLR